MKNRIVQALSGFLLCAGAASAQVPWDMQQPIPSEKIALRYYDPVGVSTADLLEVAEQLFGEKLLVAQPAGGGATVGVPVQHFLTLRSNIIIRDTPERGDQIVRALEEIVASILPPDAGAPDESTAGLEVLEYAPRFLSCNSALNALRGFRRTISIPPPGSGTVTEIDNISTFEERGLILVRETPEKLAEIRAFLERVDLPAPQAMFTLMVVRGSDAPSAAATGLPAELAENLTKLAPVQGLELLATSAVRGALRGGIAINAVAGVDGGQDLELVLRLEPSAYDPATRELTIERCYFVETTTEQSFETAFALRAGEYTVIGAVGSAPLFAVLRFDP